MMRYLLTLLVITVSVTFLLVTMCTLLLVLVVHHGLVGHVALLLVHSPAPLLAASVVHGPAPRHRELVAMFLISDTLEKSGNQLEQDKKS